MLKKTLIAAFVAFGLPAAAQSVSDVQFEAGNYGTMIGGTVVGNQFADYRLGAKAGQEMFVQMISVTSDGTGAVYFNILPPGSEGEAIYNSSVDGDTATVPLPSDGTYTIRVYLMGADADEGKATSFNIDLSIQ